LPASDTKCRQETESLFAKAFKSLLQQNRPTTNIHNVEEIAPNRLALRLLFQPKMHSGLVAVSDGGCHASGFVFAVNCDRRDFCVGDTCIRWERPDSERSKHDRIYAPGNRD